MDQPFLLMDKTGLRSGLLRTTAFVILLETSLNFYTTCNSGKFSMTEFHSKIARLSFNVFCLLLYCYSVVYDPSKQWVVHVLQACVGGTFAASTYGWYMCYEYV